MTLCDFVKDLTKDNRWFPVSKHDYSKDQEEYKKTFEKFGISYCFCNTVNFCQIYIENDLMWFYMGEQKKGPYKKYCKNRSIEVEEFEDDGAYLSISAD